MKNILKILLTLVMLLFLVPPFINYVVSIPSFLGFILIEDKSAWISFYGAIIGGALTLLGVRWTISYTESTREKDKKHHEKERKEEFERRNSETKNNLSAQYKPILDITCHPDFINDNVKFGISKRNYIYVQNSIGLQDKIFIHESDKRINLSLMIQNIGRGEANDLTIESSILDVNGLQWSSCKRYYKSLYVSNGIDLIYFKVLPDDEWEIYENKDLVNPLQIFLKITYTDLVNKKYVLTSTISIKRFIHNLSEKGEILEKVLVINPYDTIIINEIN